MRNKPRRDLVDRILTFSAIEDYSEEVFKDEDVEAGAIVIDSNTGHKVHRMVKL